MNTTMKHTLMEELEQRGFIEQTTDECIGEILENNQMTVYVWTDPTADSLHIGHFMPIMMLSHFKSYGHKPILLVWWATGMIWDPSFKSKERNLLDEETIRYNTEKITQQVNKILRNSQDNILQVVNNHDWFKDMNVLDFLRDIGKYFSVNTMLARDSVKSRLDRAGEGISYTEFSYALLQAEDFVHLHKDLWCNVQIGGSDQWGNIVAWIDLVRKKTGESVYGITCPLVKKADWTKFWKTESWNIRLDPSKTSPYAFYQFWMNVSDEDAIRFIKLYTFIPLEEIAELAEFAQKNLRERLIQKKLACEITKMIHGEQQISNILKANDVLFWCQKNADEYTDEVLQIVGEHVQNIHISKESLSIEAIIDQLANNNIMSKTEARQVLKSNGLYINGCNINEFNFTNVENTRLLLRKGKKTYYVLVLE